MFDNHKFTNNYAMHRFQSSFMMEPAHPAILAFLRSRTEASFRDCGEALADRPFVLGDKPTIADFSMAGYVYYPPDETGFDNRWRITGAGCLAASVWRRCRAGSRPMN